MQQQLLLVLVLLVLALLIITIALLRIITNSLKNKPMNWPSKPTQQIKPRNKLKSKRKKRLAQQSADSPRARR